MKRTIHDVEASVHAIENLVLSSSLRKKLQIGVDKQTAAVVLSSVKTAQNHGSYIYPKV